MHMQYSTKIMLQVLEFDIELENKKQGSINATRQTEKPECQLAPSEIGDIGRTDGIVRSAWLVGGAQDGRVINRFCTKS